MMADDRKEPSRVDRLLALFTNSRILAPVIVVGVIAIGAANFTEALTKLSPLLPFGGGLTYKASTGGPIFVTPRLNGRTIDGCVMTKKATELRDGDPEACNGPSQMSIASEFCKVAGYSRATTFNSKFMGAFQSSYKMAHVLLSNGQFNNVWNEDNSGAVIFESITCVR